MGENNVIKLAKFAEENGYNFKADNGQLVYGPPINSNNDFTPPKNSEVFIGRLPKDIDGRIIIKKFSKCGRIYMLRIMQNFSGLNRGFAFVQFETVQQADDAICLLNNCEIRPGDRIGVIRSRNNCCLYVSKLDISLTKEQITAYFNNLTTGLVNLTIHRDLNSQEKDTGFAFLEYEAHRDAARARRLLKPCKLKLGNKHFSVDWASTSSSEYFFSQNKSDTPIISSFFTGKFGNTYINNLSESFLNNQLNEPTKVKISEFVLICTNIRTDASLEELKKIFSVNSQIELFNIRKEGSLVIISYSSYETALTILKTFEEIKEEFSMCFGKSKEMCGLIWLTNNTSFSNSLVNICNSNL